ncbi:heme ABC transporter permease [Sinimarinibacterium sp. CAU 1509]|uniref:heme ABC transporter permease CcmC n=1 Tax=Sinimarinibacterium sp. CAU 1509 TaxID=2562283 RepID=UPI0010AC07DB|nr:heme ABC transporter permease CcmC [Sinimarinibacterium sp. CAU 1509]TJY60853.1 heme ABC transporter permease [Sinimarinibacterium sp. CAU 1509]
MWTWFHRLASPPSFYRLAERLAPWLGAASLLLLLGGWIDGLMFAPADYQQKDAFRIIYVHVPTAAVSLSLYSAMAVAGVVAVIWRIKLAECAMMAIAPVGASMTAVALITGMLWGKPMWGAYWVWDARLTSELVLLFLYLGVIGLYQAFDDPRAGARACALLAIVGAVNVPIVKFSVEWWNSLHQGSTLLKMGKPTMSAAMAGPLYAALAGTMLFCAYAVLRRMQNELLVRERGTRWVGELQRAQAVDDRSASV